MKNLPNGVETQRNPESGANMPRSPTSPGSHHKTPFPQTLKTIAVTLSAFCFQDDKKKKVPSDLEQLKEDAKFQEFLSVYQKRAQVAMWANDALNTELPRARTKPASDYLNFNSDWDSGLESEEEPTGEEPEDLFDPSPPDMLDHLWGEVQKQENGQDVCLDPGWT